METPDDDSNDRRSTKTSLSSSNIYTRVLTRAQGNIIVCWITFTIDRCSIYRMRDIICTLEIYYLP